MTTGAKLFIQAGRYARNRTELVLLSQGDLPHPAEDRIHLRAKMNLIERTMLASRFISQERVPFVLEFRTAPNAHKTIVPFIGRIVALTEDSFDVKTYEKLDDQFQAAGLLPQGKEEGNV